MTRSVFLVGVLLLAPVNVPSSLAQGSVASAPPAEAEAAGTSAPARTLEEQIEALDQALRVLERKLELEKEEAAAKVAQTAQATAGQGGFSLRSADGAHQVRFRGYLHLDNRTYLDDEVGAGVDSFVLRRVRPIFEATTFRLFDFRVMPDFGAGTTVLQDAYLDARFSRAASVRVGKFKAPLGLERLQSATDLMFVERALPTALVPNRDVGLMFHGEAAKARVSYALGLFNGVADGASADADDRDGKDVVARVFTHPFRGSQGAFEQLGVGIAGSVGSQRGALASTGLAAQRSLGQLTWFRYRSDGTAAGTAFADGDRHRVSTQGYYYLGRLGLLAEHVFSSQEVRREAIVEPIGSRAWQVAGSWVLTGESPSFRAVTPRQNFDTSRGTIGAVELTARVTGLSVDSAAFPLFASPTASARSITGWTAGVNWYLNRSVKIVLNYDETRFDGGAVDGNRRTERDLLTRFQIAF